MRIISGIRRGTILKSVAGNNTRPTADRIKEAIFSILMNVIPESNVLDLFSGTGSLGLEALSRGAEKAIFVDKDNEAIKVINENIKTCKLDELTEVYKMDYNIALEKLAEKKAIFDLIFIDPPYGKDIVIEALKKIGQVDILNENGIIVVESDQTDNIPDNISNFSKYDSRKYGRTIISLFRKGFEDGNIKFA